MLGSLDVTSNAGTATIDVSGTTLSGLDLALNAGEAVVLAHGDLDRGPGRERERRHVPGSPSVVP